MQVPTWLNCATSDAVWFPIVQATLGLFALLLFLREQCARRKAGRGGITLTVTRSSDSMALFYGAYVVLTGFYVAVALAAEIAEGHRVFWALLDTLLVAYVCLGNSWFRNKLVERSMSFTKESR